MEQGSNAHQTTPSLPEWDGNPLAPWQSVRSYFALKTCAHCGTSFGPKVYEPGMSRGHRVESETQFSRKNFCGKSCAKKHQNPMHSQEARDKVASTLRKIGHAPPLRGGNGKGATPQELALFAKLEGGWELGYVVKTLRRPAQGYPHHYKLDLAHPLKMLCIELDGGSHGSKDRQVQDRKKDALLRSLGWKVLRLSNEQARSLFSTCESVSTRRISRMAS